MEKPDSFINRELSWLEFNQRVLNEALRDELPVLERLKFLAITDSNLDEFFQVRLGGLYTIQLSAPEYSDQHGDRISDQVTQIEMRARRMMKGQAKLMKKGLLPLLKKEGIGMRKMKHLTDAELTAAQEYFQNYVSPLLTPMVLTEEHALEFVPSMSVCVALRIIEKDETTTRVVSIALPANISRFYRPADGGFVLLEEIIARFCGQLFPREEVSQTTIFRLTRNTDIPANEDSTEDFAKEIRQIVDDRLQSFPARLQINKDNPLTQDLVKIFDVDVARVYLMKTPLALKDFFGFSLSPEFSNLRLPSVAAAKIPEIDERPIIETLRERDLMVVNPYQHFRPVLRFIQ